MGTWRQVDDMGTWRQMGDMGTCKQVGDNGTWRQMGDMGTCTVLQTGHSAGGIGSVLSPWHCEVVTPSGAAGDSVTAVPWCLNGRKQGTASISQRLALL